VKLVESNVRTDVALKAGRPGFQFDAVDQVLPDPVKLIHDWAEARLLPDNAKVTANNNRFGLTTPCTKRRTRSIAMIIALEVTSQM